MPSAEYQHGFIAGHQEMYFHNKSHVTACYAYVYKKREILEKTSWVKYNDEKNWNNKVKKISSQRNEAKSWLLLQLE